MNEDQNHLELLSIFHYVVGGIAALIGLFPILHLVLGLSMVTDGFGSSGNSGPPELFGCFFVLGALLAIGCGLTYAACVILAGRYLKQTSHYTFCLVMAAISFGTVLGVFTILVLMRPSVQERFGRIVPEHPHPTPGP